MVNLRYKFIPYMYDLAYKAHKEGTPILRPLFFNYPFDKNVKEINDEVMLGDNIKARILQSNGAFVKKKASEPMIDSQAVFMEEAIHAKKETPEQENGLGRWLKGLLKR